MSEGVKRQWSLGLLWIITLLLASSMAFLAWKMQEIMAGNNRADLTLALEKQEKQLKQLDQAITQHDQQFQQLATHSNQVIAGLKSLDQSIREGNPQWRYAQVQFYLERAAQETFIIKDPIAARTWLQAALQTVNQLNQPNLLPIQEAIQQDIQDLSQNGGNSITQAMISLSLLSDNVKSLPHKQAPEKMPAGPSVTPAAENDNWRTAMHAGWEDLKSLVRIRTTEGDIVPYLSRDENALLNENVSLTLNQASFSAMRSQTQLYQTELAQAIQWIKLYYDATSPAVQEALTTLDHLSNVNVAFTPPSQLKSFNAWSQFIQTKEQPS